jgi:hypothetical protein
LTRVVAVVGGGIAGIVRAARVRGCASLICGLGYRSAGASKIGTAAPGSKPHHPK